MSRDITEKNSIILDETLPTMQRRIQPYHDQSNYPPSSVTMRRAKLAAKEYLYPIYTQQTSLLSKHPSLLVAYKNIIQGKTPKYL